MKTENENSSDPQVHSKNIQKQIDELVQHARADIERVAEPQHYDEKSEKAWGGSGAAHR